MNDVDVSLIIPIYNVEQYLIECLESVIGQDYDHEKYEIILINDGSKDRSGEIAKQYASQNGNIVYFEKENGGQASARNLGIKQAKGKYISFIDSDDYCSSTYISSLVSSIIENNSDISIGRTMRIYDDGHYSQPFVIGELFTGVRTDIENVVKGSSFSPWVKLYKRELFQGLFFPEHMNYEDLALIPIVMQRAKKISYVDDYLYYYRMNVNSILHASNSKIQTNRDMFKAWNILKKSELKNMPIILEYIFIRYMLASAAYKLVAFHDDKDNRLRELVEEGFTLFPNLNKSAAINLVSSYNAPFVKLLLKKKYMLAKMYVNVLEAVFALKHMIKL